jgi:hypothetical protein
MPFHPLSKAAAKEILDAVKKHGSQVAAAKALGIPRGTAQSRYRIAMQMMTPEYAPTSAPPSEQPKEKLAAQVVELKAALLRARTAPNLDEEYVKQKILELKNSNFEIPEWTTKLPRRAGDVTGVPILFASDWHWGETVDPKQIGGVNKFDMEIGHRRAERLITRAIDLCFNHLSTPRYPGIVFALGGDMVSGSIHEELEITNQKPIMPVVVDLIGVLIKCIDRLADAFGQVFVPCVTGNHGRNHKKPRAKDRVYDNFDWLIYQLLAKHFESDARVSFLIPDGSDCSFAVYNHRYLLTHGDQFRGGDGMIGMLGPVTRGDMKKRARNAQIDLEYDTMMIGHWHQLHMGTRTIVNGSLKGYDEYAASNNFGFEIPQQALWITHPTEGISFRMEVHLEDKRAAIPNREWVAVRT